jgi:hypothetical protein
MIPLLQCNFFFNVLGHIYENAGNIVEGQKPYTLQMVRDAGF